LLCPVGRDVFVNLGPVLQTALTVAAVAAFAEALGVRRTTAVLVGLVGTFAPVIATANVGSVGSDLLPFACLVLSLVFWTRWRKDESTVSLVLGGLALGVAAGSKITALLYVAAFGLGWLALLVHRRRWLGALVVLPLTVAVPAFVWYLRNLVIAGNPLWAFEFLGFPGGWFREGTGDEWSILRYLVDAAPGSFSVVVVAYAAGLFAVVPLLVVGARSWWRGLRGPGDVTDRARFAMYGVAPLVVLAAMWAQQWTSGDDGYNVPASGRYVITTFVVWLVVAMAVALAGPFARRWQWALLAAAAVQIVVSYWSPLLPTYRVSMRAVAVGVVVTAAVAVWFTVRNRTSYRPDPVFVWVVVATLAIMALPVSANRFWQNRYRQVDGLELIMPVAAAWKSRTVAVAGLAETYPLFGDDLSNRVIWVGAGDAQRPWRPGSEAEWVAALQAACVDHLVVVDHPEGWLSPVDEVLFTRGATDDALVPVFEATSEWPDRDGRPVERFTAVYDVVGQPDSCAATAG
jgi:4-amino-4-deoxy-L-arabinose transferase-like glycosyltransferase